MGPGRGGAPERQHRHRPRIRPRPRARPRLHRPAQSLMDTGIARHRLLSRSRARRVRVPRPHPPHTTALVSVPPGPTSEPSPPAVLVHRSTTLAYTQAYSRRTVSDGMTVPSRIALRVPAEVKERWQEEALAERGSPSPPSSSPRSRGRAFLRSSRPRSGSASTTFFVSKSRSPSLRSYGSVLEDKLAPAQDAWPIPADLESLGVGA